MAMKKQCFYGTMAKSCCGSMYQLFMQKKRRGNSAKPSWTMTHHINLTGHSMMNVRLAAKVLSRSVRLVLQKYGADESRNSQVYFVHGQVFDCLNSRSFEEAALTRKPDLLPYKDREDPRFQFWMSSYHISECLERVCACTAWQLHCYWQGKGVSQSPNLQRSDHDDNIF